MTVTVCTATELALDVASGDLPDAGATAPTTAADGWDITPAGIAGGRLLLRIVETGATTDTFTVEAGDYPPAHLKGLDDLEVSLAADDVKFLIVEGGRFMKSDGKIHCFCAKATTKLAAFILAKAP